MKKFDKDELRIRLREFHYDEEANLYLLPEASKLAPDIPNIGHSSEEFERSEDARSFPPHLAANRSNIIECFNFPSNSTILEFSSGSGTITRYLGRNFKSVDCIECNYLRARSIREYTKSLRNIKIYHNNIERIYFEPIYDIVLLIGILENTPRYLPNSPNPLLSLLQTAKSALKRNGLMLLAIDNKFGIKHWDDLPENHAGTPSDNTNREPKREIPMAFSKPEIKELLRKSGFSHYSFFYCYPNYKFATGIFGESGNEEKLYLHNWIDFPLSFAFKASSKRVSMREHANSFLIIATRKAPFILESDWVAKKFSKNRCMEYQCITALQLTPRPQITKSRLYSTFCSKKKELIIGSSALELSHQISNSSWIAGDLLLYDLYEVLVQDNFIEGIKKILEEYFEHIMRKFSTGKMDEEGYPLLKGNSLDFIFRNIIREETGNLAPIDLEWVVDGCIPADYIVYRCIFHDINTTLRVQFPNRIPNLNDFCINLLAAIFPHYGSHRQFKNIQSELNFQKKILPPH